MTRSNTGRDSDKFILRFPDGMRARLKQAARANDRSMNAEVVHLLALGLPAVAEESPVDLSAAPTADLMAEIARRCK